MSDSQSVSVERLLGRARSLEQEYAWSSVVESYQEALAIMPENRFLERGEVYEKSGYARYRAAMQSDSRDQFRVKIQQAVSSYEKAKDCYGRFAEQTETPRKLRCDAMVSFLGFWLAPEASEKKRLADESWKLTKEALEGFRSAREALEYVRTLDLLSASASFSETYEWNFDIRKRIVTTVTDFGEQAIFFLSESKNKDELAKAYVNTGSWLGILSHRYVDIENREGPYQKAVDYWDKARELSEETALLEFSTVDGAGVAVAWNREDFKTNCEKALELSGKTRDHLLSGGLLERLAKVTFPEINLAEDPDKRLEVGEKALDYVEQARGQFFPLSFTSPNTGSYWTDAPYAEYYWKMALFETDLEKRRALLDKAIEAAPDLFRLAEDSPNKEYGHHILSKTLASLAQIETSRDEKRRLLEDALHHRIESARMVDQLAPFLYWDRGLEQNYLADIRAGLAGLVEDHDSRKTQLEASVIAKYTGLKLCMKAVHSLERTIPAPEAEYALLGRWQLEHGNLLGLLHGLTNDREHLRKSAEAYEESARSFEKADLKSRMAESCWKAGLTYHFLDDDLKSAEVFGLASENYRAAGEKIVQLRDFYDDHASYMLAWSEIQKAKHFHSRQDYGQAREHYDKASKFLDSTKQWKYLAPNFSAWALVEHAEHLGTAESYDEAIRDYSEAARLFKEGKTGLQTKMTEIRIGEEKQMISALINAAEARQEYCEARISLEEAKLLDRNGDHYSSSEKFGHAIAILENIAKTLGSEKTLQEFKLLITLSKAWQTMARAEEETTPKLYLKASKLFEQARELSPNEKARSLALGHSRFCKGLEAGEKFTDTSDPVLHTSAVQYFESAANFYMKAGFETASEYADASRLLLDAYAYMDMASREKNQEKKTKLYVMTEKVLAASADSYTMSGHVAKREQVLKLLEKVEKERELAISLTKVLRAPAILSTTEAFLLPSPTYETAVGLERFEHADLQVSVIAHQKSLKVGENLNLKVELVNVGREPAQLVTLERVIPEGFELVETGQNYRVSDSHLDLKKKVLAPLKTEEVRLVLKPKFEGLHSFSPRLLYVDENGAYKSHQPDAVDILVSPIVEFLARCFVEDYMRKRLSIEQSGWRGLTDISDSLKIPKSQVYGEVRYGHTFGKPMETLVKAGIVEYRTFTGKGRGGRILRVRVAYDREPIRKLVDELALRPLESQRT